MRTVRIIDADGRAHTVNLGRVRAVLRGLRGGELFGHMLRAAGGDDRFRPLVQAFVVARHIGAIEAQIGLWSRS